MKTKLLYIFLIFPFFTSAQITKFSINGKIENFNSIANVYVTFQNISNRVDSIKTTNGIFNISGVIDEPTLAKVNVFYNGVGRQSDQFVLFIVGGEISLTFSNPSEKQGIKVEGPQETKDFTYKIEYPTMLINNQIDKIDQQLISARASKSIDTVSLANDRKVIVAKSFNISRDYIKTHPESMLSLIVLQTMGIGEKANPNRVKDLKDLFASLSLDVKNSARGKSYKLFLEDLK